MITRSEEIKVMNLWEKISQVSSEIEYLKKDDSVGFGKSAYKAISIEKVLTAVRDKMVKFGIVIIPIEQQYTRKDEEIPSIDKDGNKIIKYNRVSDVDCKYKVLNIDNPAEYEIVVSSGTGVDTQDKGIGKAQTYAYKTMLLRLFNIPTGEDTDKIHSDEYSEKIYNGAGSHLLSEKQIARLYAIANKAGVKPNQLVASAKKDYSKTKLEELSKSEYDALCERLEKIVK